MSLSAAKYITKYTHKGPDRAVIEIQQRDEVSEFKDCRYITASEACWHLFEFPIHHQKPAVMSLQIHLLGQHLVVFNPNESAETVAACAQQERTMLMAFFDLNKKDSYAHNYTYQELSLEFVWDHDNKQWKQRQRGKTLGRIYFVSPTAGERFYLWTLLTTVKAPTSWENLRTFDGVVHPTFHAACLACGLLENDDEWWQCLEKASLSHVSESLRRLFSLILRHCLPFESHVLWNDFRDQLCDDLAHRLQRSTNTNSDIPIEDIYDFGLFLINKDLRLHGTSLSTFPSMPNVQQNWEDHHENAYIAEQLRYNRHNEERHWEEKIASLNADQRNAFDQIYASTSAREGKVIFLHGPRGTGKTFVYKTLCHHIRANGWIVLCVASTGIASLLLSGGHTAHSTFSIPVENLDDLSCCQVDKNSKQADMLRVIRLIIWDEAVMQHRLEILHLPYSSLPHYPHRWRHAIEAVDRLLQDVCSTPHPFGGITVVFGGDFQQTLPIVVRGSRADIVHATLQHSHIWNNVDVIHLRQNMRLDTSDDSHIFAQWLLDIGHGHSTPLPTFVTMPDFMCCQNEKNLIASIYGSLKNHHPIPPPQCFRDRAILAGTNNDIRRLNSTILARLPGNERIYISADSYSIESPSQRQNNNILIEFLHSLNASGLPVSHLHLKVGCPIILLWNIDSKRGLCNGTRATIVRMLNRLLKIQLTCEDHAGETTLIPRITHTPLLTGIDFAIKLNRRQFPIQLAFAMTINKAQGQTINHVGIDLCKPVFAHGQLYVAFSCATSSRNIKVLLSDEDWRRNTPNVVYNEVLLD